MKRTVIKKWHKGQEPQFYLRFSTDNKERMTVLCKVKEVENAPDPEDFMHKKIVEAMLRVLHSDGLKNPRVSTRQKTPTVEEFAETWISQLSVGEQTLKIYRTGLVLFFESSRHTQVGDVTVVSTRPMIKTLKEKGLSENTIRSYIKPIQMMLNFAEASRVIDKAPQLEKPKAAVKNVKVYSEKDLNRLEQYLEALKDTEGDAWVRRWSPNRPKNNYRAIMMLRYYGLRAGEVWSLPLRHIDLDKMTIKIAEVKELEWKPKKNKEAELPIVGKIKDFLIEDLKCRKPEEKYYLDKGDGTVSTATPNSLNKTIHKVLKELGLQDVAKTLHGFRASAITHMLDAGVPITDVQEIARHANISTTIGYHNRRGASGKALETLQK